MKSGEDMWYCVDCEWGGKIEQAQAGQPCPRCNGYNLVADYPKSRVRGDKYTPYQGHTHWIIVANRGMGDEARANFQRRQSH